MTPATVARGDHARATRRIARLEDGETRLPAPPDEPDAVGRAVGSALGDGGPAEAAQADPREAADIRPGAAGEGVPGR